jgi:uncharacterized OB-fold protein
MEDFYKELWERAREAFVQVGVAGGHYYNKYLDLLEEKTPLGWRCPVCGRGLAPHVSECSCVLKADWDDLEKQRMYIFDPPEA